MNLPMNDLLLVQIIVVSSIIQLAVILFIVRRMINKTDQLSAQNKLLQALQELDRLILAKSISDLKTLSQDIVNLAQNNLGYFFVSIALFDKEVQGIRRIAISKTPGLEEAQKTMIPLPIDQQIVSLTEDANLYVKAFKEKRDFSSSKLFDIHRGIFPEDVSTKIQEFLKIKGVYVHPLTSQRGIFGVIGYGSGKTVEELSEFDHSIMGEFASEVSRSIEHIFLYLDLKDTSKKLYTANEKLKDLDHLKDDFVSVASHELRTPMTAIRSYAWMALHKSDVPLSEKLKKYLSRTMISTERLINLANDMLNISRIESGKIEIIPRPFRMVDLMADVAGEVGPKAAEKKLQIHILNSSVPQVFADPDKVHQVLLNLIGNAMKFTPVSGNITLSFFTDGKVVETVVKDSGVGISKEDMSRLFTKFGRLDSSYVASATSGGTGLGLFICKSLIELMHGKIWAVSEGIGKGTSFIFSLPIASASVIAHSDQYTLKGQGETKTLESVSI